MTPTLTLPLAPPTPCPTSTLSLTHIPILLFPQPPLSFFQRILLSSTSPVYQALTLTFVGLVSAFANGLTAFPACTHSLPSVPNPTAGVSSHRLDGLPLRAPVPCELPHQQKRPVRYQIRCLSLTLPLTLTPTLTLTLTPSTLIFSGSCG